MFEPDQEPLKISKEVTALNLLKEAQKGAENNISYQICEELNLFERKTGFKVKHVIVTISDNPSFDETSDDKELSVKIVLDIENFV